MQTNRALFHYGTVPETNMLGRRVVGRFQSSNHRRQRTPRTKPGYQTSVRIRKRVEEIFGWIKTIGGLRRSRYRGQERTQAWGYFVAGTYNLLRQARLELASTA